jgi:hypothetical protein
MTRVIGIFYEAIPSEMCRSWNSVGRLRVAYRQLEMKLATKTRPKQPAEDDPEQSKLFIQKAREIGADHGIERRSPH